MNLKFVINQPLLLTSALFGRRNRRDKEWIPLKDKLWEKYNAAYDLYDNKSTRRFFASPNYEKQVETIAEQTKGLIKEGLASNEFKKLLEETTEYKTWLENDWQTKKATVAKELKSILKIELPEDEYTVFVIAPIVGGGVYLGDKQIFWGDKEFWPNYNIIYLAHEYLHGVLGKLGRGDLGHSCIELATDNELRIRLNKGGEYFVCDEKPVGHKYLLETEKKLYNRWKEYLEDEKMNIYDFIEKEKNI